MYYEPSPAEAGRCLDHLFVLAYDLRVAGEPAFALDADWVRAPAMAWAAANLRGRRQKAATAQQRG